MKIGLYGYGKMGKAIEEQALQRGHSIAWKVTRANIHEVNADFLRGADVIIEFTTPESAAEHIISCVEAGVPVVTGTTGWYHDREKVKSRTEALNGALLTGTNFSLGVNLFFALNEYLAGLMGNFPDYSASITEIHHTAKLDKPSGTAISLAEQVISKHPGYTEWMLDTPGGEGGLPVYAVREENVPGTHTVAYKSAIDDIEITHTAHNRKGFALGAVLAAEFLHGKKGMYTVRDMFNF